MARKTQLHIELERLNPGTRIEQDDENDYTAPRFMRVTHVHGFKGEDLPQPKPIAPAGYVWCDWGSVWLLGKYTSQAQVDRRILLAREPWREYCDWRPDDMPRKGGNPAALARLLAECGDKGEPEDLQAAA